MERLSITQMKIPSRQVRIRTNQTSLIPHGKFLLTLRWSSNQNRSCVEKMQIGKVVGLNIQRSQGCWTPPISLLNVFGGFPSDVPRQPIV